MLSEVIANATAADYDGTGFSCLFVWNIKLKYMCVVLWSVVGIIVMCVSIEVYQSWLLTLMPLSTS